MSEFLNQVIEDNEEQLVEMAANSFSLKEFLTKSGLSKNQLAKLLNTYSIFYEKIKENIERKYQEDIENLELEKEAILNEELDEKEPRGVFIPNLPYDRIVVMDTSVSGIRGMIDLLRVQKEVVVLSVVVRELRGIKELHKKSKSGASKILMEIAQGNRPFVSTYIKQDTQKKIDDIIIEYCEKRKNEIILFTADQEMAALARGHGIEVQYFERKPLARDCIPTLKKIEEEKNKALEMEGFSQQECNEFTQYDGIEFAKGGLFLRLNDVPNRKYMAVRSKSKITRKGVVTLHKGDDIYIAKRKDDYFSFSHLTIVSTGKYNNCKLVYTAKLTKIEQVDSMPNTNYMALMRSFISSYNPPKK